MARAAARKVTIIEPGSGTGAIDDVLERDDERVASEVENVLDDLRAVITDETKVLIYKKPPQGGQWGYLDTVTPPIDPEAVVEGLKNRYGGGDYQLRIHAKGKVVTIKRVTIVGPAKMPKDENDRDNAVGEFVPLIISQQNRAASDQMQMMQLLITQMQASSQQQMQMMMQNGQQQMQMLMAMIPVLAGGKDSPATMLQAMAPFFEQMKGKPDENNMEKVFDLIIKAKEAFGDGGGSSGDFWQDAIKGALPMLGKAVENAGAAGQQTMTATSPPTMPPRAFIPQQPRPMPPAFAPPPVVRSDTVPAGAIVTEPLNLAAPSFAKASDGEPAYRSHPVLSHIGEDVLYFARRQTNPEVAAEAVLEQIDKAGVPEHEIMALVVKFSSSPDWIADLAVQGIDLSSCREWAAEFLSALVALYSQGGAADDHSAGSGGSDDDTPHDAEAGA